MSTTVCQFLRAAFAYLLVLSFVLVDGLRGSLAMF